MQWTMQGGHAMGPDVRQLEPLWVPSTPNPIFAWSMDATFQG